MDIPHGSVVADLGCGCGVLSIIAAKLGARLVYAVDMNPYALSDTIFNATINGVSKAIRPVQCDIRKSSGTLDDKVDVVVCNPPQAPVRYQDKKGKWLSISRDGGITGGSFLGAVLSQVPRLFSEARSTKKLEIVITSLLGIRSTVDRLEKAGFSPSNVASTLVPFTVIPKRPRSRGKYARVSGLDYERAVVIHATYRR
jgi:methylase of polypeptide subunit release factors